MPDNDLEQTVTTAVTTEGAKPPKPNRGGAPVGNRNRERHGIRSWAAVKRLPKSSGLIRQSLYKERDETEQTVCRQHGEISFFHAALIQSSLRHSGRAQLLERWLRTEEGLTLSERLAILKEIGAATDSRDKCLQRLGLEAKTKTDPLAAWPVFEAPAAAVGDLEGEQGVQYVDSQTTDATEVREGVQTDVADAGGTGPQATGDGSQAGPGVTS